jgi:hypothetical protein
MRRSAQPTDEMVTLAIPRAALTIMEAPRTVSQRSSERVLGVPASVFLASLRAYAAAGGAVMTLGRLRLVDVTEYVAWLRRREQPRAAATPAAEPDPIDTLARELGLGG